MTLTAQLIIDAWHPLHGRLRPSDPAQREHEFQGWTGLAAAITRLEQEADRSHGPRVIEQDPDHETGEQIHGGH